MERELELQRNIIKIEYKGKILEIEKLPNGKFKKPNLSQFTKTAPACTWLDDCRIPFQNKDDKFNSERPNMNGIGYSGGYHDFVGTNRISNEKGRFPANLIVSDDALNDGKITKNFRPNCFGKNYDNKRNLYGKYNGKNEYHAPQDKGSYSRYFDLDKWYEAQFIITPKASPSERGKDNKHPTVKPLKLMSYLITMGSRENDIILDPFCGSGTTCIATYQLHRRFIGIEKESEYVEIARKRLEPYLTQQKLII